MARASSRQSVVVPTPPFEPTKSAIGAPSLVRDGAAGIDDLVADDQFHRRSQGRAAGARARAPGAALLSRETGPESGGPGAALPARVSSSTGSSVRRFARRAQRESQRRVGVGPGQHVGLFRESLPA